MSAKLVPTFADRGVPRGQRDIPTAVMLSKSASVLKET
jgi:hypothetical protein